MLEEMRSGFFRFPLRKCGTYLYNYINYINKYSLQKTYHSPNPMFLDFPNFREKNRAIAAEKEKQKKKQKK
jgi:hypothetical protein